MSKKWDGDSTTRVSVCFLIAAVLMLALADYTAGQLALDFYAQTCSQTEQIVTTAVQTASFVDPVIPAKMLRLVFHDCFVQGCDGSILLDSTGNNTAEKDDPANLTVEGYTVVDNIKTTLELVCPGVVSCADIVALAARDAVAQVGGPVVPILTGRKDGRLSDASIVRFNLPDTTFNLDQLLKFFTAKGLNMNDIVTLAGAHTIGVAHCNAFNDRFQFNNGTPQVDPTMNPSFSESLLQTCPQTPDPSTTVPLDTTTPNVFDNAYYFDLETGKGLMTADETLFSDPRSKNLVQSFAVNQATFFQNWEQSFLKLTQVDVKTGFDGEIRSSCRVINS